MHSVILDSYENRAVNVKSTEAQTQLRILANHLIVSNYLQDTSSEVINAELDMLANLYDGRVIVINDDLKVVKDTYNISQGKTIISEEVVNCLKTGSKGTVSKYDQANGYIEIVTPIIESEDIEEEDVSVSGKVSEVVRGVLLTSVSTETIAVTLEILSRRAQTLEIMIILIILLFAAWVSIMLLRPFDRITTAINDVKAGYTDEPIVGPNYLETEQIINAFNALLRRMKVLDDSRQEFVSNVSHELKTPISSISLAAQMLNDGAVSKNEKMTQHLGNVINEETRRLRLLVDTVLQMSMFDRKDAVLKKKDTDIAEIVHHVAHAFQLRVEHTQGNIHIDNEATHTHIIADEMHITNAINNIVDNSIKYRDPQRPLHLRIRTWNENNCFAISISDNGMGIKKEHLKKIFDKFYRIHTGNRHDIKGFGLGLAYVRNVATLHGGSISVESEYGKGTTFTLMLPLCQTQQSTTTNN